MSDMVTTAPILAGVGAIRPRRQPLYWLRRPEIRPFFVFPVSSGRITIICRGGQQAEFADIIVLTSLVDPLALWFSFRGFIKLLAARKLCQPSV
jgi:hypothetical protein